MTLIQLSKQIQSELKEGVLNFIIYKQNNTWLWEYFDIGLSLKDCPDPDAVREYNKYKAIDPKIIIINGYEHFAAYNLKYIQEHIKTLYNRQ